MSRRASTATRSQGLAWRGDNQDVAAPRHGLFEWTDRALVEADELSSSDPHAAAGHVILS
jgi:hypothetical protein